METGNKISTLHLDYIKHKFGSYKEELSMSE